MPKNSQSTWKCPSCRKSSKVVKNSKNSNDCVVTLVKNHVQTPREKCNPIGELTEEHFDIIRSPTGCLDCIIIHDAQTLLPNINTAVKGFQRPTLGPCGQFEIIVGDFVQILHVNGNHWVCVSSINCQPGYVNILDSLSTGIISEELEKLIRSILGPHYQGVNTLVVQQQRNSCDCGLFALAFATSLVFGQNPEHPNFNVKLMRPHLCACLRNRYIETFPVC